MPPRRLRVARAQKQRCNKSDREEDEEEEEDDEPLKPLPTLKPNGAMFLLLLFASSVAGHYYPVLWRGIRPKQGPEEDLEHSRRVALSTAKTEPSAHQRSRSGSSSLEQQQLETPPVAISTPGASFLGSSKASFFGGQRGNEWQSVFVRDVRIQMHEEPACKGVIPAKFHPVDDSNRQPITKLEDLLRPNQRVLVFLARHGLGNSLRSYVSAYVFALLSGRRLVRLHAAEHAKVYDLLCESFECGFDAIRWENKSGSLPMDLYRQFGVMKPFYFLEVYRKNSDIAESISSEYPIFATRSGSHFDVYWHRRDGFRECVYAAFKCSSLWCVHSRAMHALIGRGGPTKNLDYVMSQILHRHEPVNLAGSIAPLAAMPSGKKAVFDIALHIRTRTLAIEKRVKKDTERYTDSECEDPENVPQESNKFLKACLWECIGTIFDTLRQNLPMKRGLTILLATDDAELRPEFVKRLERHGTIFFSKGSILHTSKAGGSLIMRLPTMAEFFLMAKSHTLIEAGSYISTFAYFSGLLGNCTLAAIKIKDGGCRLRLEHKAEL